MLVLSRKRGETVVIGIDITVTVLEVRGDRVKLGFGAPAEVPIHRSEVHQSIEKESSLDEDVDVWDDMSLAKRVEIVRAKRRGVFV